jgi:hypothetical protein
MINTEEVKPDYADLLSALGEKAKGLREVSERQLGSPPHF